MRAAALLLSPGEVSRTIGRGVIVREQRQPRMQPAGEVLKAASADSAFRHYVGTAGGTSAGQAFAVTLMSLVFERPGTAEHMFEQVAGAAHLRTAIQDCNVAVETVAAASGLVSYWGYVQRDEAMVLVTLDTLDPQSMSMADLRGLVTATAERMSRVLQSSGQEL